MKAKSFSGMRCSIAGALELIGDRWALLIIRDLSLGLSRYDDLRTSTGIPAATLAARLKHLAASGIVERVRYQERPPRDEYCANGAIAGMRADTAHRRSKPSIAKPADL